MIIWIASYPKSGNTYLRSFIPSYYFSKKGKFDFDLLLNILQFPSKKFSKKKNNSELEACQSWIYNQQQFFSGEKLHFIKTHSNLNEYKGNNFTTKNLTLGGIYIVRDPRNLITSMTHHYSLNYDKTENARCQKAIQPCFTLSKGITPPSQGTHFFFNKSVIIYGAGKGARTLDLLVGNETLYH